MNWFANLFSSSSSSSDTARRKMAFVSTHDAFSLPTTSPITSSHPNGFHRSSSDAFDVDSMTPSSSSYAYPPPASPTTYDYLPRQNGKYPNSSRQGSLLPLHSPAPLVPLPPYPPLEQTWNRLRNWLSREYPELGDTLNWGILPQDLGDIELALGTTLPHPVRESYLLVDGQEAESSAGCSEGLFFGLYFLPLEDVLDEWRFWREVDNDPATGMNGRLKESMKSLPPGWVRREYSSRGWIPLVSDKTGNYLGIDLTPGESGVAGQVIVFGRDFDTKVVMWRGEGAAGWANWLAAFVDDLESGEGYEIGPTSDGSEESEDDVGYEGYFFDGSGRSKGDGDGESGGNLRLTGEYRGWSVLEAWADKSVKRWRDTGVIAEKGTSPQVETKGVNKRMSVLDVASPITDDSAEVPIPVFSEPNGAESTDSATPTAAGSSGLQSSVPVIHVTKPPAPLPVDLPSLGDFRSSSSTSSRSTSFETDLEQGTSKVSLDEVDHPLSGTSVAVKPPPVTTSAPGRPASASVSTVKEGTLVQIPLEEETMTPRTQTQDLLQSSDSSEVLFTPMDPVTTPVNERKPIEEDLLIQSSPDSSLTLAAEEVPVEEVKQETLTDDKAQAVEAPVVEEKEKEEPEVTTEKVEETSEDAAEEEQDPDTTIRLVGGGGSAGIISSEAEHAADADDTASLRSESSVGTFMTTDGANESEAGGDKEKGPVKKLKKHDKKKSLSASLKRISQLGGSGASRKRADSKGSTKSTSSMAAP